MFFFLISFLSLIPSILSSCSCSSQSNGASINNGFVTFIVNSSTLTWSLKTSTASPVENGILPSLELWGVDNLVWNFVSATCSNCSLLVVQTIQDQQSTFQLRVSRKYHLYDGFSFVRHSASVSLDRGIPVSIRSFDLLNIRHPLVPQDSMTVYRVEQWGSYQDVNPAMRLREDIVNVGKVPSITLFGSFPSYSHFSPVSISWAAMASSSLLSEVENSFVDPKNLRHVLFGLEFNGKSQGEYYVAAPPVGDGAGYFFVSSIFEINHTVASGLPFDWPASFVGCWDGDVDDASYTTHRFQEAHISPPLPDQNYPWVQFDSWAYGPDINAQNMGICANISAQLGIEAFVLDLGWATNIGDWTIDKTKFPQGAAFLSNFGFRLGLHFPLAEINLTVPILQSNPNWPAFITNDYYGATALCLGNDPARQWLISSILSALQFNNATYIVQDGEDMIKYCLRSDHSHNPGDSNYANSHLGLDQVWKSVRAAQPNIVLENCEDGGTMMTFQMARLFTTSIAVDNTDNFRTRQGVFSTTYAFSPRYSVRYFQEFPPTKFGMRSSIFGGPLILQLPLSQLTPDTFNMLNNSITEFKKYRKFIRDGQVVHLQAPQGSALTDPQGFGYDAIQSVNPNRTAALCFVYRCAIGGEDSFQLKPRKLQPQLKFNVTFVDQKSSFIMTGSQLASKGFPVSLSPLSSEIIEIKSI